MSKNGLENNLYTYDQVIGIFGGVLAESLKKLDKLQPMKIVRCKDCKWCRKHDDTDGNAPYWTCRNWDGGTDADGFCYEAERKEDD